jgi:hypothetical protein
MLTGSSEHREYSEADKKRLREKDAARKREYRKNNGERVRALDRARRERNPDKHRMKDAACYERNKERWHDVRRARDKRRINMAGNKTIVLWKNPRTGKCSNCENKVGDGCKRTSMHHEFGYITILPWFGLKELCNRCHIKLLWV